MIMSHDHDKCTSMSGLQTLVRLDTKLNLTQMKTRLCRIDSLYSGMHSKVLDHVIFKAVFLVFVY